jgi:predicted MPP superfamily phosphohydrolase
MKGKTQQFNYEELEQRLGKDLLLQRLERQSIDTMRFWGFSLKRPLDLLSKPHGLIRLGLKSVGLWHRGCRNALAIEVVEHHLQLPTLPEELSGMRILHLTDMHFGFNPAFTDHLVRAIQSIDYDLLVCTGDFRFATSGPCDETLRESERLMEALEPPVYTVLGNHDPIEMVPDLERMGYRVLLNESVQLNHGGVDFHLLGVDDPHHFETAAVSNATEGVAPNGFRLLISHSSEVYQEAERLGIDCMLNGHTHGGQICLPGGWPILNHADAPRAFCSGPWRFGKLVGYTSRGSGCTGLPIRFNCPPEITLHVLSTPVG